MHEAEKRKFAWSKNTSHAYAARESSLFHTNKPVIEYSEKTELNEPLATGVSMKEMCAGLLGQVYFTLPLARNEAGQWVPSTLKSMDAFYSPYASSATPNISALEDFMLKVSREAFYNSPYYRHHAMRHLASNSTACPSYATILQKTHEQQKAGWNASENAYAIIASGIPASGIPASSSAAERMQEWLPNFENVTLERKGFMSHLLGAASTSTCFCGFQKQVDGISNKSLCVIPENIVRDIQVFGRVSLPSTLDFAYLQDRIIRDQGGIYDLLTENHRVQRTLSKIWLPEIWECPELSHVSDHWGFVADTDSWISGNESTSLNAWDFLEKGHGGLRVGTMQHVKRQVAMNLHPGLRIGVQNPSDGGPITGHTRCAADEPHMRPESLADQFIDDLFPAAQGVRESAPISHCLRFTIEVARLQALTVAGNLLKVEENTFSQQSFVANSWKAKCAAQIDMVGMCAMTKALDVVGGRWSTGEPSCPFHWSSQPSTAIATWGYITPGCLVYIHNTRQAYDPCR
jgi:hypothetical protein